MERIPWGRYTGDDIESVVAMLLCREHADAFRIRPSQGDQGIDVAVPVEGGSLEIYQVKKFDESLSGNQWKQVRKSYERLRDSEWASERTISGWHLVLPLDPTTGDLDSLTEITKASPWPAHWKGLSFIEGLVAKYPEVIDYYLRDGKERLDASVKQLTDLLTMQMGIGKGVGALAPSDAVVPLRALFDVLNGSDPFYAYALSVDVTMPEPKSLDTPGLVVAETRGSPSTGFVTIKVIARCAESVRERSIPLQMTLDVSSPGLRASVEEFRIYGTPLVVPPEAVSGSIDLPGGLGGSIEGATVSIQPVDDVGEGLDLRVQVVDVDGMVVAECRLTRTSRSAGPSGIGIFTSHSSPHGALTLEMRFDRKAGTTSCSLRRSDVAGAPPDEILPALEVFHAAGKNPNRLRISRPWGPDTAGQLFPPAPAPDIELPSPDPLVTLAQALTDIQQVSAERIVMPAEGEVTSQQLHVLTQAAALVRGETVRLPWTKKATLYYAPNALELPESDIFTLAIPGPFKVQVGAHEFDLGSLEHRFLAARVVPCSMRNYDDKTELEIEPTEGSQRLIRSLTSLEIPKKAE